MALDATGGAVSSAPEAHEVFKALGWGKLL